MSESLALDDQVIVAIRRISQAVESYSRYLWQTHGLTAPQLGTLRELSRRPFASPGQLAGWLHISPPTVAGILKRLEQRGLVARVRNVEDRRSFDIQLTETGRQLCASAPSLLRDQFRQELTNLPLWERTQTLATLQRVAEMLSAAPMDTAPFFYHESPSHPDAPTEPVLAYSPHAIPSPVNLSPETVAIAADNRSIDAVIIAHESRQA